MTNYKNINTVLGWLVFLIATAVYFITLEDTVSLWDCGEYITAAYKLEVGHPPGAPLFMVIGRLFSFFADPTDVAVWINRLSALSSSFTILFMFWSLTILIKKMVLKNKEELSMADQIAIFGSATVGSLAYTFSESFWFSAVEGEVYAMASLFTAIIFWAALKWDEEMSLIKDKRVNSDQGQARWLILIMFLLGLAVGVHLLGILVVPAIGFILYFRYQPKITPKGLILTALISVFVLGFIQEGIIPGSISLASTFEVAFVNSLGLPFFSGTIFFFILLVIVCVVLIRFARENKKYILYNAIMGLIVLLIGYGSFAVIVIRSNANTPLDENDPENLVTLHSYLKREQYGSAPLFKGPFWNSIEDDRDNYKDLSPYYLRRFVVMKGDLEVKAYKNEKDAQAFAQKEGGEVQEKYFESNSSVRKNSVATYSGDQSTLFPRMYWNQEQQRIDGYKRWSGYDESSEEGTAVGKDGQRLPTMGENISYFLNYQVNWMYVRYFMWNFAGRQNDIQGHGDAMRGNWLSGFSFIDEMRLGSQENAPYYTKENKSNNKFFLIPLILGVLGLFFHFYKAPKDAFVLFLAFIFTGLAIVVYLNQKPFEPRERDYAYAGSFYFFAFWIGISVYAMFDAFKRLVMKEFIKIVYLFLGGFVLFAVIDTKGDSGLSSAMTWLIIAAGGIGLMLLMSLIKKIIPNENSGPILATLIGLTAPLIMGMQGWDDHDRSGKTSAHELASNYLNSCTPNSIIFTNGDNDTFPLWYMQEVEGMKTDVRVCNLSLMQTDWYTEQMKMRAYKSDPLPIKFREDQILMYAGNTDQVLFSGLLSLANMNAGEDVMKKIIELRMKQMPNEMKTSAKANVSSISALLAMVTADPANQAALNKSKNKLLNLDTTNLVNDALNRTFGTLELIQGISNSTFKGSEEIMKQLQQAYDNYEKSWDYTNLASAMEFVRDDKNQVVYEGQSKLRIFPSSGFILPVNADNAVKSGIITAAQKTECYNELKFNFEEQGLTREQVMMLDILANNEWKRGIFFSSPGGSDVAMALNKTGYIKQNGMAYVLSPVKNRRNRFDDEVMYNNLMKRYDFGDMKNPSVLTDYYARRHTSQYRYQFMTLAQHYLTLAEEEETFYKNPDQSAEYYKRSGEEIRAKFLLDGKATATERIKGYKTKAVNLLKRSMEVMPIETVIDGGEPNPSRESYKDGGREKQSFQDGVLQDYMELFYAAGDKESAEKYGLSVAKKVESVINYFLTSDVKFVGSSENSDDFYANLDAFMKLNKVAKENNPSGELAKYTTSKVDGWYNSRFKEISAELVSKENLNADFALYVELIGIHYGKLKGTTPVAPQNGEQKLDSAMIRQMMNQQKVKTDSIKKK
jgi:hypothetical protein